MKYLIFGIVYFLSMNLNAQILSEESQILDKKGGEAIFRLNAGEKLFSLDEEEGWYRITKTVYIDEINLMEDKYVSANTPLMNKEGAKVGETLAEVKVKDKRLIKGFRNKNTYAISLQGYIFKTKLEKNSVPEERIEDLLLVKNRMEQIAGFKELFETYNFEQREFGELTAYSFRDPNSSAAEENDFRIIVIFRGETSLYALITNNHHIEVPKIKDEVEDGNFKVSYLYKPSPANKDLIENTILYTYLAL